MAKWVLVLLLAIGVHAGPKLLTEVFMVAHCHTDAGWIEDPDVPFT